MCVTISHPSLCLFLGSICHFNVFQPCILKHFQRKLWSCLIVSSLHLCQTPHAAVVVILFPGAGKWHQVMSSPIKSDLKCVKFQAITRIVRDWGGRDRDKAPFDFSWCHLEGDKDISEQSELVLTPVWLSVSAGKAES